MTRLLAYLRHLAGYLAYPWQWWTSFWRYLLGETVTPLPMEQDDEE